MDMDKLDQVAAIDRQLHDLQTELHAAGDDWAKHARLQAKTGELVMGKNLILGRD